MSIAFEQLILDNISGDTPRRKYINYQVNEWKAKLGDLVYQWAVDINFESEEALSMNLTPMDLQLKYNELCIAIRQAIKEAGDVYNMKNEEEGL